MLLTAVGTRSYPSIPALSLRRSRASIASHTNTNFETTWTARGHCSQWSSYANAGRACSLSITQEASLSIASSVNRWRSDSFSGLQRPCPAALGQLHGRGLIHKDIKPTNVLVDSATGRVYLTGFGIASRLPRERQAPEPPEVLAGTLAYMAPEQTGRVNRSIDSRSDLYSLGVTFYEMLTGGLPFTEPIRWSGCTVTSRDNRSHPAND